MMTFVELLLWIILIITLLVYIKHYYSKSYDKSVTMFGLFRESMSKMEDPPKVVLFGDSILNNSRYVPLGKSVGASLQDIYRTGFKTYAQDGALIHNVYNQANQYSEYNNASGEVSGNKHIIISVGGNNLLNAMNVNALTDSKIDNFASQYKILVKHICNTFPDAHIYLMNVYHPTGKRYHKISKYIDRWSESVSSVVEEMGLERVLLIDIDSIVIEEEDFVSEVEPSTKGGKKIARAIVSKINEVL